MTARPRSAILALSAVLLFAGRPGTVAAAQSGSGDWKPGLGRGTDVACGQVHLFMMTWVTADKAVAVKANSDLRSMLRAKFDSKDWCVIPQTQTDAQLKASGFRTDSALPVMDALQLASGTVRADVFLEAEFKPAGSGFEYTGTIYYVGDDHAWLRERVPKSDGGSNGTQAATAFVMRIKEVLKAYEPTNRCRNLAGHDQKFTEAVAAAQQALVAYPEGTVARICLATALQGLKKSPDERLAIVSEVLKRDPESPRALILAINAYDEKNDDKQFQSVAGQFVAIDPGNKIVEEIIQRLIDKKLTEQALVFIAKALGSDPDNRNLRRAEFRLVYGGEHWKEAAQKGEALATLDTAAVDTIFIQRMVSAYNRDSQPEKVLAWLKLATEKFPEVSSFTQGYAQQLMAMNQVPMAIAVYKRLIKTSPETPEIRLRIANTYSDLGQTDSAFAWQGRHSGAPGAEPRDAALHFLRAREHRRCSDGEQRA